MSSIPIVIETAQKANLQINDEIDSYRMAVHSIRGTSLGIGALELGNLAEKLEKAVIKKDFLFIKANNTSFIEKVEALIQDIITFLDSNGEEPESKKPEKAAPSPKIINTIVKACKNFDINSLKKAIGSLDEYKYNKYPELVSWLREQANISNFVEIQKKLEAEHF